MAEIEDEDEFEVEDDLKHPKCQRIIRPWTTPFLSPGTENDFDRPSGTGPLCIVTQALCAWLRSACPSGTKAIHPSKCLALS
jgi:hypothetical protein